MEVGQARWANVSGEWPGEGGGQATFTHCLVAMGQQVAARWLVPSSSLLIHHFPVPPHPLPAALTPT